MSALLVASGRKATRADGDVALNCVCAATQAGAVARGVQARWPEAFGCGGSRMAVWRTRSAQRQCRYTVAGPWAS